MKTFIKTIVTITVIGSLFTGPAGWAFSAGGFSADMVSRSQGQQVEGKIYFSEGKARMEMMQTIMITRLDRKVSWMIMTSEKMYMEQPFDPSVTAKVSKEMPGELERVPLGAETVDGKPAQKFKVTYSQNGRQDSIYQWIGASDFPVKVEATDGSWSVEYRNVTVGPQPDSLFEVPDGYQKFAMPSLPAGMTLPAGAQNQE